MIDYLESTKPDANPNLTQVPFVTIKLRQSDLRCVRSSLFPMYTEECPRVDSHVENSSKWYINRHDHHHLRRTMGEHVGNANTNRAQSKYTQSKLEDIMIEGI